MGGKGSGVAAGARNRGYIDPEFNSRSIAFTRKISSLPKIDFGNPDEMNARFDEFLDYCDEYSIRPLVGNFALAFGMNKRTLWDILNDERSGVKMGFTPETTLLLKSFYVVIESNFEQLLTDANNPVPNIYYSKAILGWREAASETIVTHRSERQLTGTVEEVAAKYAAIAGSDTETMELPSPSED